MKNLIKATIVFLLFIYPSLFYGQSFSGELCYKAEFEVLPSLQKSGITREVLIEQLRSNGLWFDEYCVTYGDNGAFRLTYKSNPLLYMIYLPDSNKNFTCFDTARTCYTVDASLDKEFALGGQRPTIQIDTLYKIGKKICSAVKVIWSTGHFEYVFEPGYLPVNASLFENYHLDGWGQYLNVAGYLPIQITKETTGMMRVTYTLVSVTEKHAAHHLFELPPYQIDYPQR